MVSIQRWACIAPEMGLAISISMFPFLPARIPEAVLGPGVTTVIILL
jgi:hypothetical protein